MLKIPADPTRFAHYEDLIDLEAETQLPMIVDAEMGMPLELGQNDDAYWTGNEALINPSEPLEPLDDEDIALLAPPMTGKAVGPGGSILTARPKEAVTWLRRTEYISSERKPLTQSQTLAPAPRKVEVVPVTASSRADTIARMFSDANVPLEEVRHPTKRGLKPLAAYPVLPEMRSKEITYSLIRFAEDPNEQRIPETGQVQHNVDGSRVTFGMVRPQEGNSGLRLGLYLPTAADVPSLSEVRAQDRREDAPEPSDRRYEYQFTRDYDEVKVNREPVGEFVFAFSDGTGPIMATNGMDVDNAPRPEPAGAFYVPITATRNVRKRRMRKGDDPAYYGRHAEDEGYQFWHSISATMAGPAYEGLLTSAYTQRVEQEAAPEPQDAPAEEPPADEATPVHSPVDSD